MSTPFIMLSSASRGLSRGFARTLLRSTTLPMVVGSRHDDLDSVKDKLLKDLDDKSIDPKRLNVVKLDITDEPTLSAARSQVQDLFPQGRLRLFLSTAGILFPEKSPAEIELENVHKSFNMNVIGPLLLIKHFNDLLPKHSEEKFSKEKGVNDVSVWACMSARVGSTSDNSLGGWYSYRASKAAMNSVVKTFDLHLQRTAKKNAIAVGLHPGTVRTDLSKDFWESVERRKGLLFEADESAEKLVNVLQNLQLKQRGKIWDYKGEEILP